MEPLDKGVKLDDGKVPVHRGLFDYFPRALMEVARVSQKGVETSGYPWGGWRDVPNALERYTDARGRHLLGESIQTHDPKTGCLEAAHVAWNALAVLELLLTPPQPEEELITPIREDYRKRK